MKALDYLNLCYIWTRSYPTRARVWSGEWEADEIRVNYGHDRVPGPDEHVFGGLVKLQDLGRAFPGFTDKPNILYLVSSALPYFPVQLAMMAKKNGAKIVINQNGVAYPGWYGKGYERENRSMSRLHDMADYVFYQSDFCKLSAEKYLGCRERQDRSEILYNPVDIEFFKPVKGVAGQDSGVRVLLSGSHWTTYRVFTALETLKIILASRADVNLDIAGRFCWGECVEQMESEVYAYAEQLGVKENVRYTGPYSQEEAPQLLNNSSLLLHTKYNDPCPRLVVEAMACGLPVVYSATGGVPELVGEFAGEGVRGPLDWEKDHPPEPEKLAACIIKVIDRLPEYSAAARRRAELNFGVDRWIERHREVFGELLFN